LSDGFRHGGIVSLIAIFAHGGVPAVWACTEPAEVTAVGARGNKTVAQKRDRFSYTCGKFLRINGLMEKGIKIEEGK
jgi:hypothetical protein